MLLQVILSFCLLGVHASPTIVNDYDAGSSSHRHSATPPRSFRQKPPPGLHGGALRIFDPSHAKAELKGILRKYAQAAAFLQGIGLNPEQDITAQYHFVSDTILPSPFSPESSSLTLSESSMPTDPSPIIPPVSVPAAGTALMPVRDFMSGTLDILYYGPLNFGTPSQRLTVDIDTGSADLWIPVNCQNCENKQFDAEISSTYRDLHRKFSVSYGVGAVKGTLATDVVSLAGLTVAEQAFGAVSSESDEFNGYPNSGLLGIAFGTIAQSKRPTFFENLMSEKRVAAPLFSVHFGRNQETGSEVCFGCYDTTKANGPISWVPVKSKTYWSVAMDGLNVNSTLSVPTDIVAAIDTGTTLIYLPSNDAAQFYSQIPGSAPATQYGPEFYTYPCAADRSLSIVFSFSGQLFSLNAFDFNLGRTSVDSPNCVGGILSLGNGFPSNLAIIGDEFLKSWYTTFDYSNGARVGFSPSVNNR